MQNATKKLLINAGLFQTVWFAAVYGSAKGWLWPCLVLLVALISWQLQASQRAPSDLKLVVIALVMGLIIDSLWIILGILEYTDKRPLDDLAPFWILALWAGFALTINHSMAWLKTHPLLPALMGLITAPLSYYAGEKLGAVIYLHDALVVSAYIGLAWAVALPILVRLSESSLLNLSPDKTT